MLRPLNDPKAFVSLYRSGHRFQTGLFTLVYDFGQSQDSSGAAASDPATTLFLGFVLPKKLVKRAVDRNQVKRWVRSALSQVAFPKTTRLVIRPRIKLFLRSVPDKRRVQDDLYSLIKTTQSQLRHGE
ncbi:MAG: ribonuclease P protein component [Betaproteobacteria bacterium]|nr:ribonuclease P protein component [Betaproteobacteria bacterium]